MPTIRENEIAEAAQIHPWDEMTIVIENWQEYGLEKDRLTVIEADFEPVFGHVTSVVQELSNLEMVQMSAEDAPNNYKMTDFDEKSKTITIRLSGKAFGLQEVAV